MKPLPLSDRIALFVARRRRTARELSGILETDIATVHKTLNGLEDQGVLERQPDTSPTLWRTAKGVEVAYFPGRIEVLHPTNGVMGESPDEEGVVQSEDEGPEEDEQRDDRCRAVTSRGTRCQLTAKRDGLCGIHAP